MISVEQASKLIAEHTPQLPAHTIDLAEAAGRVLRATVRADRDQPPFDRATMDGIAVHSTATGRDLRLIGIQAAGQPAGQLNNPEECVEIMTGAPLPTGADCVVPVEVIRVDEGRVHLGRDAVLKPWRYVHRRGTDYPQGETLLAAGSLLGPAEIAVLASVGAARVEVSQWPAITVISTGDELRAVDQSVADHQIRRCNDYAIAAALGRLGLDRITSLHIADDPPALRDGLGAALDRGDWLILSGGVSKGRFDFLPDTLAALGVERHFHRISQRPGKPMWFGTRASAAVFALPGNPVSALVCLHRYVLPALRAAAGASIQTFQVTLDCDVAPHGQLTHFVPIALDGEHLQARELNTSGDFFGLAGTLGFVEVDARRAHCNAGTPLPFYPWQR